jgi:hypothetical protein
MNPRRVAGNKESRQYRDVPHVVIVRSLQTRLCLASTQESFRLDVLDGGPVEGFVGFFDVQFRGSPEYPADFPVSCS